MIVEPQDRFSGDGADGLSVSVMDFWKWGFANLCDDDVKGWFAEWLVGHLLDIKMERRISWANSDLITPSGVRIEVKSTAVWQSWKLLNEDGSNKKPTPLRDNYISSVRFGGLIAKNSVESDNNDGSLKSNLYVFALQHHSDHKTWNAMNLEQWEFYLATKADLQAIGTKTISLTKLRKMFEPMTASEFRTKGREAVRAMGELLGTQATIALAPA